MDEPDTAACLADRLLEPEDGLLGPFSGVYERFILVFSHAVCAPGRGERHDNEEGEDGTRDQGEERGLGEGVNIVPFQVWREAELRGEGVEDCRVVFWEFVRMAKEGGEEGGTEDCEGLYAVYYFCLGRHFKVCHVVRKK